MKTKLHYVFSITMFLLVFSVVGQNSSWKPLESIDNLSSLSKYRLTKDHVQLFELDAASLKNALSDSSKNDNNKTNSSFIKIPGKNGELESFQIFEASVFSPDLARQFPEIKSYVGTSNTGARLRMSISPLGVQTMISYLDSSIQFMQPISHGAKEYVSYNKSSKSYFENGFNCSTLESIAESFNKNESIKMDEGGANDKTLRKFRIAISVTGEYTAYFGGTVAGALAGINNTLSRVNELFETDMAVTFELVNAPQLIYTNPATDPYSDAGIGADESNANSPSGWSTQLQNTLTSVLGNAAYDIGHLFGASGGGGNAGCIGCVCTDNIKGRGYTSPSDAVPQGDTFDLNYVAHEIGHQMGANHTWSFESEGTGVQAEPGSGSTIMAYAGVTDSDDIQLNSDAYFHYISIKQILTNLQSKTCQTNTTIANNPPNANAGSNYTIPKGTPYVLRGTATDPDGTNNLTYCWEQINSGVVTSANFSSTLTSGSTNRSLPPNSSPNRYIPSLKSVINGRLTESNPNVGSLWESVSTVARTLNWALTVRDQAPATVNGNGQSSYDTMTINVDGVAGPFVVTSQNSNDIVWTPGTSEIITWNVANTNSGSVNTSNVNILLSTNGGLTFETVLKSNTPNDGNESISVPIISSPNCRIMVEAANNIFYAVNSQNFAINYNVVTNCPQPYNSALNLNLPVSDSQQATNNINVPTGGTISDVKVGINITHTYVDDLVVTLTHPNGTSFSNLWNRNCNDESNIIMTFEDWQNNIDCTNTGSGNTFAPSELLDVFNGLDAAGNWNITVKDLASGDNGTLNSWYLEICTQSSTIINPNPQVEIEGIHVYPVPNDGSFTVAFNSESNKPINIIISDVRGQVIFNTDFPNTGTFREPITLKNAASGMYVVGISDGNFSTKRKIIVN